MAEIVVSTVIAVLIEKLLSGDLMKLARFEKIDSQLKKWKKILPLIQAVLADAGQKYMTHKAIELWLHDLQELAYDIDDVLDDLATEAMKRNLNQESYASTSNSNKIIKIFHYGFTHFMYGRKMSSKLDEISNRLHDLVDQKNNLGLDANVKVERSNRTNRRLEQTSLIDKSKVLGREGDIEALLEKLLGNEACHKDVSIVSIVGLGGIGKTTLAKLLYNDAKVMYHFELRVWVCISDVFDVFNISKAIYQAVVGEDKVFANLDLLHVALKEKLSKKRFLLVLDDVWNEDHKEWEILEQPLVGAPGSKIIVTTRKTTVASVMNCVQPHILGVLSNEYALSLLAKYALDEENFDKHPSLIQIAQCIIEKCNGLPLALIALGRLLKTKGTDHDEWEELLKSEVWSLHDGSDVLPALKLSYYDLAPHLKQLFAYCSLFPKDYSFNKIGLVLLWMAEGFLYQPKGNMSMESLGLQYFEELKLRSFFQHSVDNVSEYTMHDLMNDLAISVAGEFFCMLDNKMDVNGRNESFEKFRHFSFIGQRHDVYRKFKELHRATHLRTFLPVSLGWREFNRLDNDLVELLPQLQFLRVLSLTDYSITKVPESIGSLKHLRYLNFSRTDIKHLPKQVSELYNLQSLLVRDCHDLSSLPVSFVKLINLRHLDMTATSRLNKTPLGIGGLTSLRTLSKIYIEEDNGFKISELKDLVNLQGGLSINGLDKVKDPMQAKDANLQQKKGLSDLDMKWSHVSDDFRNLQTEYEVLEWLRPQRKLKKLNISFYWGMKFPSWVGDSSFDQLTELTLEGCRSCTHLPTLGHLSSLRKMFVKSMCGVKIVGIELLAPSNSFNGIAFPSLELLEVSDMQNLEIWSTSCGDNEGTSKSFPRLAEIRIQDCLKLVEISIGLIPSLQDLSIKGCCEAVLRAMVGVSSSIFILRIRDIKGLNLLHGQVLKHLGVVEYLFIEDCDELRYLCDSEWEACRFLVILRRLYVYNCKKLVSIGRKEVNVGISLKYVREVTLIDCETLKSYNCPNLSIESLIIRYCSSMTSLTFSTTFKKLPSSLKFLEVNNCKNLKSFPHKQLRSLVCLEELNIDRCQSLDDSFPCGLWPPNLRILKIGCLNKPMSKWGLQNYPTSLVKLELYGIDSGVVSFAMEENVRNTSSASFLLPPSLTHLSICNFKDVESLSEVLQHLTRLEELDIRRCPNLRNVPETTSTLKVWVS